MPLSSHIRRVLLPAELLRTGSLTLIVGLSAMSVGCPELNRWSGPNKDPFFSVPDEPRAQATESPRAGQRSAGKPVHTPRGHE